MSLPEGARPPESGVRAAGPGGSAHCEPRGDAARRGREGGGRAAFGCRTRNPRSPPLHRRSPTGGGAWGGGGRAGWGPRGAAATPGSSTRALRQAATRAHLPAAAAGCVIGCPRRAREIELSIHSGARRAGGRARARGGGRALPAGSRGRALPSSDPEARARAGRGRARPPPPPPADLAEAASVGACPPVVPRAARSWRNPGRRSLGCALREAGATL